MRSCVRVLGLLGPLGGCFVDPGNATVGGPGGGSTTGGTGGAEVTGAASTGSTAQVPEPTGTSTGAAGSTTTGEVLPGTDTGGTTGGTTGMVTTLDASTGGSSTGGVELPVPGCVPLFFTDFSQDPKNVLDLHGKWAWNQIQGTVTVATQDGESSQAITKGSWQDSVVYARVRVSSGYAVVRTRQVDGLLGGTNYFGSMQPWSDKLQLGLAANGQAMVFKNPTFPTEVGVWYTMAIRAQGSDLSFGLDDQVLTGASDGQLTMGRASIGGYLPGEAEFDWFLVCVAD